MCQHVDAYGLFRFERPGLYSYYFSNITALRRENLVKAELETLMSLHEEGALTVWSCIQDCWMSHGKCLVCLNMTRKEFESRQQWTDAELTASACWERRVEESQKWREERQQPMPWGSSGLKYRKSLTKLKVQEDQPHKEVTSGGRVLQEPGGILIDKRPLISNDAQKVVWDRVLTDSDFWRQRYEGKGLEVLSFSELLAYFHHYSLVVPRTRKQMEATIKAHQRFLANQLDEIQDKAAELLEKPMKRGATVQGTPAPSSVVGFPTSPSRFAPLATGVEVSQDSIECTQPSVVVPSAPPQTTVSPPSPPRLPTRRAIRSARCSEQLATREDVVPSLLDLSMLQARQERLTLHVAALRRLLAILFDPDRILPIIPVRLGTSTRVYSALWDSGSQGDFIHPRVVKEARLPTTESPTPISVTLGDDKTQRFFDQTVTDLPFFLTLEPTDRSPTSRRHRSSAHFDVMETGYDFILGTPWSCRFRSTEADWATNTLVLKTKCGQTYRVPFIGTTATPRPDPPPPEPFVPTRSPSITVTSPRQFAHFIRQDDVTFFMVNVTDLLHYDPPCPDAELIPLEPDPPSIFIAPISTSVPPPSVEFTPPSRADADAEELARYTADLEPAVRDLIREYHDVFPSSFSYAGIPPMRDVEHSIQLVPNYRAFLTKLKLTPRQARWWRDLFEFSFTTEHIKGETNRVADALSRRPNHDQEQIQLSSILVTTVHHSVIDEFRTQYRHCPDYRDIHATLRSGKTVPNYSLGDNGLVYWHDSQGTREPRICVPSTGQLRVRAVAEFHDQAAADHMGFHKTLGRVSRLYVWPKHKDFVKDYVAECPTCQEVNSANHLPYGLLQPLPIPEGRWKSISMDFIGPLRPPTPRGHDAILVVVDRFTKLARFVPCRYAISAREVTDIVFDRVVRDHGLPLSIISDREPRFTSRFWRRLHEVYGTRLRFSSSYHPQTDGQTEITNRTLGDILRKIVRDDQQWDLHLAHAEICLQPRRLASHGDVALLLRPRLSPSCSRGLPSTVTDAPQHELSRAG
ncbi:hypothetical protein CBR_g58812 [Chara braunii]|uniref:Integrase catalytic domain-containing protein n=1 Tax=Chara braunii TaxID=69332 RepID=A0A388K8F9_CHABU|nr:hypothetical protein CBR_g58812 [Chara braunii]|eukprot:GBG66321.1 hypothetical protein CBR_g58812 [Chara braunii]